MKIKKINKEQAWTLRHQVMWPDKPLDYIKVQDDEIGIHYGLFKEDTLVSVVSLFINGNTCQFRKFATQQQEQGKGFGTKLLEFVFKEAKQHGVGKIWCNARENKSTFYKKFGLNKTDDRFEKGGRLYVVMEKELK
ncbi:GNAT family N-acetyltransferase [Aquibacillus sediminis]|uniref:GNAT family N-acetyltransferase n=1 Tax=Aquibacillus sediminis TaxID=2574734 RepID=UPI0011091E31|nr:GNAT family N-acetyltransferase [Aquibacillus sediminis]